ncbi:hypothetical protein BJ138DRAFT_1160144 [Hygrophoropsis aurantiaca]|uniref:Uncharacterized protein n=1 Tax=Hygrophoropsis aurantiaca TaxID=72124 RepID=A0ACB8A2S7_9AGAM|nr:hypothetical protein BJ138DRAFT_1160144 [Hygrophoropsis aurantiaca]
MSEAPFPPFPISGITIPTTPLVLAALEYSQSHTSVTTVNHCLRSTAFALILARKDPAYASVDPETIALCTILHDMGWATTKLDGANIARDFIQTEIAHADHDTGKAKFDEHRIQLIWDAIALHTTPSISAHKQKEVALTTFGILGDIAGPHHPSGMISVDEYKEVVRAFPRAGFREAIPQIMCALCTEKPETTYDNAVGEMGLKFGAEGYREKWEKNRMSDVLHGALEACKQYEE